MADEAADVSSDITVDDFEGKQETPKVESSPAKEAKETEAEKPVEAKDKKEDKAETPTPPDLSPKTDTEDEPEEKSESEVDETVVDKPKGAEERKSQLNSEIRDLVAQRNTLKEEVAKANEEVYQPATETELEAEGMSATDAKVEALRQRIEVRDYNDKVADAQLTIESESNRVIQDFPVFNPDSKDFDEELHGEAAQLLQQNLILDPNTGQVIGSNVSPYQLYKTLARASGISGQKGQLKGQQDTEKMLANVDTGGGSAPQKKSEDPLMKLFLED